MRRRVFYVDAVRACACFLVVISHVFAPVCAGMNDYPRPVWWVFNLFDSLIRPSASLYVMISGKLFLGSSRQESYWRFVWNRYTRLILPFFSWSMIYVCYEAWQQDTSYSVGGAIWKFLNGPTEYHLWFMYLILGIYWMMPPLRRFVRGATPTGLTVFLTGWMAFLTVQFFFPTYIPVNPLTMLMSYGGYTVLGYVLDKTDVLHKRIGRFFFLGISIILFNAAATFILTVRNGGTLNEKFYFGSAPLVALQAAAMFLLLKNVDEESIFYKLSWLRRPIEQVGRNSYNIYLGHALFISLFTEGVLGFTLSHNTGSTPWTGVPLTTIAVLVCSLALTVLLQQIPVLSKLFVITPPRDSGSPLT